MHACIGACGHEGIRAFVHACALALAVLGFCLFNYLQIVHTHNVFISQPFLLLFFTMAAQESPGQKRRQSVPRTATGKGARGPLGASTPPSFLTRVPIVIIAPPEFGQTSSVSEMEQMICAC